MAWIGQTVASIKFIKPRELLSQAITLGMIVSSALIIWKSLMSVTGSKSPVVVVLSESIKPAFQRGDILFLRMTKDPIREPMAKAKRLHGNHLFHLGCLRLERVSRLDQGLNEIYSCPTCRKPLFAGRIEGEANPRRVEVSSDEQLARHIERVNNPGLAPATRLFPAEMPNSAESDPSRNLGLDPSWLQTWSGQGVDVAGPSTASRSVGGRVQMMMRHLASVGESYAQTALDDATWSLWPMNSSQASTSSTMVPTGVGGRTCSLHLRTVSSVTNESMANILVMADTVRACLDQFHQDL